MAGYNLNDLLRLMANLRDPEHGCPWDREQTLASIVPHTLDEVYEVIDTIEREDHAHLCDELGDLLFQVVFYAQISAEAGRFDFARIVDGLVTKLLRRHPHVFPDGSLASFGSGSPLTEAEIKANWERIKAEERAAKEVSGELDDLPASVLDDISAALPALLRAHKLQKRAATVGFDWRQLEPVFTNLESEISELREAVASGDRAAIVDELGDLLFSCVNLSRHLQQDAEQSLRQANHKFETRFRRVEQLAADAGIAMAEADEAELDRLWQRAKAELTASTGR
ncbi:nucleoside triphosphate pyrophosphohydrolase [Motiliproteus sediminis]|uniref:nucleoside triphosphate pyrophosphohydrolase n=1 Tax=Motiliproteus sediminis TaxID=1468178 RepID=UPI001AF00405|nr:nucleoside triphosphate pyrophosphohydrolase [Motiliproteus sediminis]